MWVILILGALISQVGAYETCYATDMNPYVKFGTKTAYEFVGSKNMNQYAIPNCEPVMIWSLNRPEVRLPSAGRIKELRDLEQFQRAIMTNYESGNIDRVSNTRLCRTDIENLRAWRWRNTNKPEELTSQGYLDTQGRARAWKSRYPTVMTNDSKDYLFKYVKDSLNENSFQAYAEGLFGQGAASISIPKDHDETLLQPFKKCKVWSRDVDHSNDTRRQVDIFTSKLEFRNMVMNVSSRLGFSFPVNNRDVDKMWDMCRLDKAFDLNMPSPWCAAFTKSDLQMMEYVEDLKSYYGSGYGSHLNTKLGCAPVKDMLDFFSKYVYNQVVPPKPKAVVMFAPSAMLLMTLTAMGAYQDTVPLLGDNYKTPLIQTRHWKTSDLDPFGANLVAVLHRCRDQGEQFRVMFYLNEHPIQLNGCAVGLCEWSWVKARFGHVAEKCDVKKFCQNGAQTQAVNVIAAMFVLLVSVFSLF